MSTAVEVSDLRIELVGRDADVVDEITLAIEPGEVLGLVGESGSGKTTVGMALLGHVRRGGRVGGGAVVIDGRDLAGLDAAGLRGPARRHGRVHPAGPGHVAQPGAAAAHAAARDARRARRGAQRRGARRAPARGARGGRAAVGRRVPRALPAPAVGRPAAARRDRDGVRVPAERDRLRRADHRPRRHHPGSRARDGARPVPQPQRRGAVREPRPGRRRRAGRPGRGHVRRADRRGGDARPAVRRRAAPVHAAAAAGGAGPPGQARGRRHPRLRAAAGAAAGRVLLRAALRARDRRVPQRVPACVRVRARPPRALLPRRRGDARGAGRGRRRGGARGARAGPGARDPRARRAPR